MRRTRSDKARPKTVFAPAGFKPKAAAIAPDESPRTVLAPSAEPSPAGKHTVFVPDAARPLPLRPEPPETRQDAAPAPEPHPAPEPVTQDEPSSGGGFVVIALCIGALVFGASLAVTLIATGVKVPIPERFAQLLPEGWRDSLPVEVAALPQTPAAPDAAQTGDGGQEDPEGVENAEGDYHEFPSSDVIALPGPPVTIALAQAGVSLIRTLNVAHDIPGLPAGAPIFSLSDRLVSIGPRPKGRAGDIEDYRYSSIGAGTADVADGSPGAATQAEAVDHFGRVDSGRPADVTVVNLSREPTPSTRLPEELVIPVKNTSDFAQFLDDLAIAPSGEAFASIFETEHGFAGELEPGDLVHLRYLRKANESARTVAQLSLYRNDRYVGTIAQADDGSYTVGAEPSTIAALRASLKSEDVAGESNPPRLLDAIYEVALRNSVPSDVIGEILFHLSRSIDLAQPVQPRDRLQMLFTDSPRVEGLALGEVLYLGLRQASGDFDCYIVRLRVSPHFGCASIAGETLTAADVPSDGGMVVPVKGVLTSKFGYRFHPIHKERRLHAGVDWGAPKGTPVVAAFPGKVYSAGWGGGYGNLIQVDHSEGVRTRYAHLNKFADGIEGGVEVGAGQLIGFVGTTGSSTGNHLHFEVRKNARGGSRGEPVDPLDNDIAVLAETAEIEPAKPTFLAEELAALKALTGAANL